MASNHPGDNENRNLEEEEPDFLRQTIELGNILQDLSNRAPNAPASEKVAFVYRKWLVSAKDGSDDARYFDDILENFPIETSSHRDLFVLFEMLHSYVNYIE